MTGCTFAFNTAFVLIGTGYVPINKPPNTAYVKVKYGEPVMKLFVLTYQNINYGMRHIPVMYNCPEVTYFLLPLHHC